MPNTKTRITKREFANFIIKQIERAGETETLRYDNESFALVGPDDRVLYLDDVFRAIQDPENDGTVMVKNVVRTWFRPKDVLPGDYEDVRNDLLVCVSPRHRYELQFNQDGNKSTVPYDLLGNHVAASVVYDLPECLRHVDEADLRTWGVDFAAVLEEAKQNLRDMIGLARFDVLRPGVFAANADENYNSGLLLLPELLDALDVKGDLVAMVPSRRTLLLTGTEDAEGLAEVAEIAKSEFEKPWSRSGIALRLSNGEWGDFLPEPDHPAYAALSTLRRWSFFRAYGMRTSLLRAQLGDELFVARYLPVHLPNTEDVLSVCTWADGDPSLLPKTDFIGFCSRQPGVPVMKCVSWQEALENVGELMTPTDHYPERVEVNQFPTAKQLLAMKDYGLQM